MNSAMNVNNNFKKNYYKSDEMADEDPADEACLPAKQNSYNARQLNNGQIMREGSTLSSLISGSNRKGIKVMVMFFVLLVTVVAICASFFMLSLLGVQRMHIRNLQSELEALKAENMACKNETSSLVLQLVTCEKELLGKQHQIEVNAVQCEQEKANITNQLKAEIRESEHKVEIVQEKLNACDLAKNDLSQRLETQERNAENERKTLTDRLDQCQREQREARQGREEDIRRQVEERLAAESSRAANRERWSSRVASSPNSAGHLEPFEAIFLFSSMFLSILFKVHIFA